MKIIEEQFTNYDKYLHPEYDNSNYLSNRVVETGLSKEICYFGNKLLFDNNKYIWIQKNNLKKLECLILELNDVKSLIELSNFRIKIIMEI